MTTTPPSPPGQQPPDIPWTQQPYPPPPGAQVPYGGFPNPYQPAPPRPPARNGMGITALCLGIVGVLFGFIPLTFFLAVILGLLALVFGLIGLARTRKGAATNPKTTIFGLVLAGLALALGIWGATILFQATNKFVDDMNNIGVPGRNATAAPAVPAPPAASQPSAAGKFPGAHANDSVGQGGDTLMVGTMQLKATKLRSVTTQYVGPQKCSTVTYINTGTSQETFNPFDWKLQNPSGAAVSASFTSGDNQLHSGDLAPGGTQTGDVCFDAKTAVAGQYVLLYQPGWSTTAPRGAWLN